MLIAELSIHWSELSLLCLIKVDDVLCSICERDLQGRRNQEGDDDQQDPPPNRRPEGSTRNRCYLRGAEPLRNA